MAGAPGDLGLHVPGAVEGDLRLGGDIVTVQPRPMVEETAVVRDLKRENVTVRHVLTMSQVKTIEIHLTFNTHACCNRI